MDQNAKDILAIAHGYTQQMGKIHGTEKWVGRMFWNAAQIAKEESCPACKLLKFDGDQAIMDDTTQSKEIAWAICDLVYGRAVKEAQGFVMFMPFLTVEDRIHLMVSPDGHGYGHLTGDDSL